VTANQGTANATPWNENIAQVGGSAVSLGAKASASSIPVVLASDQANIPSVVSTVNSSTATLGANAVFTGTSESILGFQNITVTAFANVASATGGLSIQQSEDGTNWDTVITATVNASVGTPVTIPVLGQFLRVVYTNGGTIQTTFRLQTIKQTFSNGVVRGYVADAVGVPAGSIYPVLVGGINGSSGNASAVAQCINGGTRNALVVTPCAQGTYTDAAANAQPSASGGGGNGIQAVATCASTGTAAQTMLRTPAIWRGSQFSAAGQNTLWMPPSTKKVRLMRYKIEIGEDATLSGGPLPINLAFTEQLGTATGATLAYPGFGFTHRDVIPATVLSTGSNISDSDWIDLGNGQLLTTAGRALQMGIMVPQTTGAVNPAWTIASNQWEAATIGFKTNGSLGNFKLVQQTNGVASAASVALPAISVSSGNAVYVFIRITRAAGGGTPTVAVTDTAANTYTNSALTANASDSANGSVILVASSTNVVGNAANVITVTTSVNAATQIEAIALEYSGMGTGGVDAALVGTSGNSTTPASGNYTPSTAGDLIFSFFGTAASLASQPTVGSNFQLRGTLFNATQGALGVSDNFGNGALTTGVINVFCAGTEE